MSSILKSTGIVALSTLASRILGFVREMLFAYAFGATGSTDAFFVAFRIPNLFRRLVAEGALTISFIPVYTEYLIKEGEAEALALAQKTLTILFGVLALIVGLGILFSPELVKAFAYGFKDERDILLATDLTRIMFPYLMLVGIVAFAMGVLNSHRYFFAPSFSPVLLNVGIISGILSSFVFDLSLYGPAFGVLFGGVMQLILQLPYMAKSGFRMKVSLDFNHPGIRKIFRMITPALFGIAVYQINILISTLLASLLPSGSVSYLYYSDRLTELALGLFVVSIGNAILPEMSKLTATENFSRLKELYLKSINAALFLAIPSAVALIVIGPQIINVFFQRGQFSSFDADMTYRALFFASIGIGSVSILRITTPTFYSMKDTKTPVIAASVAFVMNISLGYALMNTRLLHGGLALANTISVTVQMLILVAALQSRIGKIDFKKFLVAFVKISLSSAAMALFLYFFMKLFNWGNASMAVRASALFASVVTGALIYFAAAYLLRIDEVRYLINKIRARRRRS